MIVEKIEKLCKDNDTAPCLVSYHLMEDMAYVMNFLTDHDAGFLNLSLYEDEYRLKAVSEVIDAIIDYELKRDGQFRPNVDEFAELSESVWHELMSKGLI